MFLICGEALYDVFPETETATGFALDARIGGSSFNLAVGLARLGRRVAFFSGLSSDPLGRRLEKALSEEGVDTCYVVKKHNPTTLAVVGLGAGGVPHFTFYGHEAADRVLAAADLPDLPAEVAGLHFGSFSLMVGQTAETLETLARREAAGRLISLDPNVRLGVEPDAAAWRRRVERYSEIADIVKVSAEDLDLLFPGEAIDSVIARWHARGVSLVVVTRGAAGAIASLHGERIEMPGRKVATVDTVGAGDSFQAALLSGLEDLGKATKAGLAALTPEEVRRLVDFAISAAAVTCSRRGADLPRRGELPEF
ncbi:MAG: carbohydrate kinase [Kiloniellaceae bacterium]